MQQLVECVPNFSEGRDQGIIDDIASAIRAVDGATLLDVDPGYDTHRTVITFVGSPVSVVEAAFRAMERAAALIDMSNHKGAHPRMGATDVCPFIPLQGITAEQCIPLAEALAERVARELGIPMYLYGKAAKHPDRVRLPDIRKGEYEALEEKLKDPAFCPDFGKPMFNARSGATATGVRNFLLAYNINLSTRDVRIAKDIGLTVRETGRKARDDAGKLIRDENGVVKRVPGLLKKCQAGGWYIDSYGQAQVTMNLLNFSDTGLHTAFETVCAEAEKRGVRVTGSEVVGMLPRQTILDAGRHFLKKAGKCLGLPESEIVHTAILGLGLNDISLFKPSEKIIEYAVEKDLKTLRSLDVCRFADELSSDSPAPGGGSIAALAGALSAGLSSMVANLTFNSNAHAAEHDEMAGIAEDAQELKDKLLRLLDADTDAFNNYLKAKRMPRKKASDKQIRAEALESAAKEMTLVPMETLRLSRTLVGLSKTLVEKGLNAALSDAAMGAVQARAACLGAYFNVMINLPSVEDKAFVTDVAAEAETALKEVEESAEAIVNQTKETLSR